MVSDTSRSEDIVCMYQVIEGYTYTVEAEFAAPCHGEERRGDIDAKNRWYGHVLSSVYIAVGVDTANEASASASASDREECGGLC